MSIRNDRKRIILNRVVRLVSKNSNALHLMGVALKGLLTGSFSKQMVSRVFDFDPESELPVEDLVAEALLNGLEKEDIEEIFKRYARRKGLEFSLLRIGPGVTNPSSVFHPVLSYIPSASCVTLSTSSTP